MARASQHRASRVRHGWFASTTTAPKRPAPTFCANRERDPGAPSRMRGRRSGRLDGRERSRMGDAFRPPSPAPFVVVTEAADGPERERVERPANCASKATTNSIGHSKHSSDLSSHPELAMPCCPSPCLFLLPASCQKENLSPPRELARSEIFLPLPICNQPPFFFPSPSTTPRSPRPRQLLLTPTAATYSVPWTIQATRSKLLARTGLNSTPPKALSSQRFTSRTLE